MQSYRKRTYASWAGRDLKMLRPPSNPQQGHLWPKIHHLDFGELLVVNYMLVIGIKDSFQSISSDNHHVHNWGSVQMDQASIWHVFSIWGVAMLNPHGPCRPTYWWYLGPRLQHNWRGRQNDHNRDLIMVLEWFENLNVEFYFAKRDFSFTRLPSWAALSPHGLQPNPGIIQVVTSVPTLVNKQVRRFLGAINYLSKYCLQLSSITQFPHNLTKDGTPFFW